MKLFFSSCQSECLISMCRPRISANVVAASRRRGDR